MKKNLSKIPRLAQNDIEQFILSFTIKLKKTLDKFVCL